MYRLAEKEKILDNHIIEFLLRCKDAVSSKYPNTQIILYVSQARADTHPESDVDLLVLLDEQIAEQQKRDIHDLIYDIGLAADIVISAIIKSVDKWNLPISQATPLYQNIRKEGIKVA